VALGTDAWDENLSRGVQASRELKAAHLMLGLRVRAARRDGRTWVAIALALGITEQAARRRYGE
jgi:hypothetical protein